MKSYILDPGNITSFENENDPIKIISMKFCYANIFDDIKECSLIYAAYTENNERIVFIQQILLSDEDMNHIRISSPYISITGKNNIDIKSSDHTDACNYILFPNQNGVLMTDFMLRDNKSDIIYASRIGENNEMTTFKFKLDKHILLGIYCINRCLNNYLSIHSDIYRFANDWMIGDIFIKSILKNSSIRIVTSFELMNKTKTIKQGYKKYRGIAIYKFNTIASFDDDIDTDFVMTIQYENSRHIRRDCISKADYERDYINIAYEIKNITAISIDLETMYLFCENKYSNKMIVLSINKELFDKLRESLLDLLN